MGTDVYEFMIGDFECAVISDGSADVIPNTAKVLFANAPEGELVQALREHNIHDYNIPYRVNCLFINSGEHRILVDTGFGQGVHPAFGNLADNLQTLKVSPEDIDILVLTHLHGDHVGGVTDHAGKLIYPNARHMMSKVEWDYWMMAALDEASARVVQNKLLPINSKMELIEPNAEIVPGIKLVPMPGHTPGHAGLSITSGGDTLLQCVDSFLDPIHTEHPTWVAPVDMSAEKTVATRRDLMTMAAMDRPLVLGYHFAFPGLGYIEAQGEGFGWRTM